MVYKVFDKKTQPGLNVQDVLAEKITQTSDVKFKRRNVYARCKGSIQVEVQKKEGEGGGGNLHLIVVLTIYCGCDRCFIQICMS